MATNPNLKADPIIIFRDAQHASRLFVDDDFRLAPKFKFLFHVAFGINPAAVKTIDIVQRHRNEINMLVKSVSLPAFEIKTETLNQYNRKKNVQVTHSYQPIDIKFHDDNMGVINQLWQNYYSYYYADSTSAKTAGAYNRIATKSSSYINTPYGLDNRSSVNFFNYIKIYQMARHEYVSYTLYNPIISSWNHNGLDYAQNALHDNSMKIVYEAVSYDVGKVTPGDPEGFAVEHYDQTPSPLTIDSSATNNSVSFTNNSTLVNNAPSFFKSLTDQLNTQTNLQRPPTTPAGNIVFTGNANTKSLSGIRDVNFPLTNVPGVTQATARKIVK